MHTSPAEGFPNTLLEAWAHGLPSLSAVDPDGIVARESLGAVVESVDALEAAARRWMANPEWRRAAGARARSYAIGHHAPEAVLERFSALLDAMVERTRTRRTARR